MNDHVKLCRERFYNDKDHESYNNGSKVIVPLKPAPPKPEKLFGFRDIVNLFALGTKPLLSPFIGVAGLLGGTSYLVNKTGNMR